MAGTAVYMAPEVMQAGDMVADAPQLGAGTEKDSSAQDPRSNPVQPLNHSLGAKKRSDLSIKKRSSQQRRGYGKRADIWSVGMTLCEMALGRAPFPNAGAAIFAVCVSKKFPGFPDEFSADAHTFLGR